MTEIIDRKEELRSNAEYYIKSGFSIIPTGPDKRPLIQWKEHQERRATIEEVEGWLETFPNMQLGAVTGKISGIVVVDIEKGGQTDWLPKTAIAKTGGDGYHYYYSYVPGMTNKVRIRDLVDIRSDGGYVIIPPSTSDKGKYEWLVKEPPVPFPIHLFREAEIGISNTSNVSASYPGFGKGQRNNEMARYVGFILAKVHPSEWETIGWNIIAEANTKNDPPLNADELRATFISIMNMEKRNNSDRWYKKTTATEESNIWKETDNKILTMKEIAEMEQFGEGDRYKLNMKIFDDALEGGFEDGDLIIVSGMSGMGKCHGRGTKIMMHDGSIKNVEDIVVGDKLMGDDSTPRNVLSLARGHDEIYSINDMYGNELYTGNSEHVLSLRRSGTYEIDNIKISDYIKKKSTYTRVYKGYKVGVSFVEKHTDIDPYFLGLWLGDGTSDNIGITSCDKEIVDYIYSYAQTLDMKVNVIDQKNNNSNIYSITRRRDCAGVDKRYKTGYGENKSLKKILKNIGVLGSKHIPDIFKFNSRGKRLKLLAGLIDSDGYMTDNCYEITQKNKTLAEDILWLARSLGMGAKIKKRIKGIKSTGFIGEYWSVSIYGELSDVPVLLKRKMCHKRRQLKNPLNYGIVVKRKGLDNYYGFEIDGNHLYLLGDFSVTHNTTLSQNMAVNFAQQGLPVLFLSYEVKVSHLWKKFQEQGDMTDLPIYSVQKNTTGNVGWIEEKIKEAREDQCIKIVVIDHLGFLMPRTSMKDISSNYSVYVGQICRDLKQIALRENIVIVMPVHVRKSDEAPDMNSLAHSAGIAQESDCVIIVHRDKAPNGSLNYYMDNSRIMMVKNRKTGQNVQGYFKLERGRFVEVSYETEKIVKDFERWQPPTSKIQEKMV